MRDTLGVVVLDIVLVEPIQLIDVEAGGGLVDLIDIEQLDQLIQGCLLYTSDAADE